MFGKKPEWTKINDDLFELSIPELAIGNVRFKPRYLHRLDNNVYCLRYEWKDPALPHGKQPLWVFYHPTSRTPILQIYSIIDEVIMSRDEGARKRGDWVPGPYVVMEIFRWCDNPLYFFLEIRTHNGSTAPANPLLSGIGDRIGIVCEKCFEDRLMKTPGIEILAANFYPMMQTPFILECKRRWDLLLGVPENQKSGLRQSLGKVLGRFRKHPKRNP
jgi:hypothetical protein